MPLLFLIIFIYCRPAVFDEIYVTLPGQSRRLITDGYVASVPSGTSAIIETTISPRDLLRRRLRITADDCLEALSLESLQIPINSSAISGPKCDWHTAGQFLNLSEEFLRLNTLIDKPRLTLTMGISNQIDRGGVFLRWIAPFWSLFNLGLLLLFSAFLFLTFRLKKRYALTIPEWSLLGVAVALRLMYFAFSPFPSKTIDLPSHLLYLDYVEGIFAGDWRIPPTPYFFPPFFYIIAAGIHGIVHLLGGKTADFFYAMDAFSFCCSVVFFLAAWLTSRRLLDQLLSRLIALGILATWPALIIHCARFSYDPLIFAASAAGIFYLTVWWQTSSRTAYKIATAAAAVALLTKLSGLAVAVAVVTLPILKGVQKSGAGALSRKSYFVSVLVLLIAFLGNSGSNIGAFFLLDRPSLLFGTHLQEGDLANTLQEWVRFSITEFLRSVIPYHSQLLSGRVSVLEYLVASAPYGSGLFNVEIGNQLLWCRLLQVSVLGMTICLVLKFFMLSRREILEFLPAALPSILLVGLLFLFRFRHASHPSGDFRYMLPAAPFLAILFAESLARVRAQGLFVMSCILSLFALTFIAAGAALIVECTILSS